MEQKKNVNLGLNLIRVWLSFEVVIDHYWHQKGLTGVAQFLSGTRSLAVPCFLLHVWVFPKVGIGVETFAGCVAIWVASWVLCLLVALIPGRFAKSMVE